MLPGFMGLPEMAIVNDLRKGSGMDTVKCLC